MEQMEQMEQIERIEAMEEKLNAASAAIRALALALARYREVQADIATLDAYLGGDDWREDFEADENGLLPDGLRRGVLSEDGIYGMLEENAELLETIREFAQAPGEDA